MSPRSPRIDIDFLRPHQSSHTSAPRRRLVPFGVGLGVIIGLTFLASRFIFLPTSDAEVRAAKPILKSIISTVPLLNRLPLVENKNLTGEDRDRVDILLLGMGGVGHDGPLLTDTIILASLEPSTGRVALLPIPRDTALPFPDGISRKANMANALGHVAQPGSGPEFARELIGKMLGRNITYHVLVDFAGFAKAIDALGGITVDVERPFTDTQFPTGNNKTKTISFEAGRQHMKGERALEYVRSRHGSNGESSDFARARRQERLLAGLLDRTRQPTVWLNPRRLLAVKNELASHIFSNLEGKEALRLLELARGIRRDAITLAEFGEAPNGLLVAVAGADGAYLLAPRNWDYSLLKKVAEEMLEPRQTPARLIVENGTNIEGHAARLADKLTQAGFNVMTVRNAPHPVARTAIYDLSQGIRTSDLVKINSLIKGTIHTTIPGFLATASAAELSLTPTLLTEPEADFLIILGLQE